MKSKYFKSFLTGQFNDKSLSKTRKKNVKNDSEFAIRLCELWKWPQGLGSAPCWASLRIVAQVGETVIKGAQGGVVAAICLPTIASMLSDSAAVSVLMYGGNTAQGRQSPIHVLITGDSQPVKEIIRFVT